MISGNIAIKSLKESFSLIKKNKKIFALIFIIQILFFLLVIMANVRYMPLILQSAQEAIDYAESLSINPEAANIGILQQKSPLGNDPLLISRNYNSIIKNSFFLLFFIFLIFFLINGSLWYFSSNIAEKSRNLFSLKNILHYLAKFFIISVILFLFFYLMTYNVFNIVFSSYLSSKPINSVPILLIALIAIYFNYISIPILKNFKLGSLAKKSFLTGTKNLIPIVISLFIILIFIISSLILIFYAIEMNLFLLLFFILLAVFAFAWSKVYFSIVIRKLSGL